MNPLPFRSAVADYEAQAARLLGAWRAGDRTAVDLFRHHHPRFLDDTIGWLAKRLSVDELRSAPIDESDARLALARWYDFADWARLCEYAEAVADPESAVARFEAGAEAIVDGDAVGLMTLLRSDPALICARSTRVTRFDPPVHRATLLHYVAANGVEGHRQRTPPNAVEIARHLLDAGAEVDALAGMYGASSPTLTMLVSSSPPARAALQEPLADTLLDFGADIEGAGDGPWKSPLMTALAFGFLDTARLIARRGARADTVAAAAGLGLARDVRRLLPHASAEDRHRGLALAAQLGHVEIVRLLLDAGEDPNRYNPAATHAHATPLHQAVAAGHLPVVALLVGRGARLDVKDTIYQGTPLGWAEYLGRLEIAAYLRERR